MSRLLNMNGEKIETCRDCGRPANPNHKLSMPFWDDYYCDECWEKLDHRAHALGIIAAILAFIAIIALLLMIHGPVA